MLFGSIKSAGPPIAVDFGVSRLKVLQIAPRTEGGPPAIIAAASRSTPPELLDLPGPRLEHQSKALGEILRTGGFRGRRAVCSVSSLYTVVQHLQIVKQEGKPSEPQVLEELRGITGREPEQFILRHHEVGEVTRGGTKRTEIICLAMPREVVIAHMKALKACRLDAAGIHAEHTALVKGLNAIAGSAGHGDSTILVIDIGGGATKIAVSHKGALKMAKVLPVGGKMLHGVEPRPAAADPPSGRKALRAQLEALEAEVESTVAVMDAPAPIVPAALDALADEVAQCMRYYQALFPDRKIERAVFVGGESANVDVCKRIARSLGVPAQVADPLNAVPRDPGARLDGVGLSSPTPEWAVALGLTSLPTEA